MPWWLLPSSCHTREAPNRGNTFEVNSSSNIRARHLASRHSWFSQNLACQSNYACEAAGTRASLAFLLGNNARVTFLDSGASNQPEYSALTLDRVSHCNHVRPSRNGDCRLNKAAWPAASFNKSSGKRLQVPASKSM